MWIKSFQNFEKLFRSNFLVDAIAGSHKWVLKDMNEDRLRAIKFCQSSGEDRLVLSCIELCGGWEFKWRVDSKTCFIGYSVHTLRRNAYFFAAKQKKNYTIFIKNLFNSGFNTHQLVMRNTGILPSKLHNYGYGCLSSNNSLTNCWALGLQRNIWSNTVSNESNELCFCFDAYNWYTPLSHRISHNWNSIAILIKIYMNIFSRITTNRSKYRITKLCNFRNKYQTLKS